MQTQQRSSPTTLGPVDDNAVVSTPKAKLEEEDEEERMLRLQTENEKTTLEGCLRSLFLSSNHPNNVHRDTITQQNHFGVGSVGEKQHESRHGEGADLDHDMNKDGYISALVARRQVSVESALGTESDYQHTKYDSVLCLGHCLDLILDNGYVNNDFNDRELLELAGAQAANMDNVERQSGATKITDITHSSARMTAYMNSLEKIPIKVISAHHHDVHAGTESGVEGGPSQEVNSTRYIYNLKILDDNEWDYEGLLFSIEGRVRETGLVSYKKMKQNYNRDYYVLLGSESKSSHPMEDSTAESALLQAEESELINALLALPSQETSPEDSIKDSPTGSAHSGHYSVGDSVPLEKNVLVPAEHQDTHPLVSSTSSSRRGGESNTLAVEIQGHGRNASGAVHFDGDNAERSFQTSGSLDRRSVLMSQSKAKSHGRELSTDSKGGSSNASPQARHRNLKELENATPASVIYASNTRVIEEGVDVGEDDGGVIQPSKLKPSSHSHLPWLPGRNSSTRKSMSFFGLTKSGHRHTSSEHTAGGPDSPNIKQHRHHASIYMVSLPGSSSARSRYTASEDSHRDRDLHGCDFPSHRSLPSDPTFANRSYRNHFNLGHYVRGHKSSKKTQLTDGTSTPTAREVYVEQLVNRAKADIHLRKDVIRLKQQKIEASKRTLFRYTSQLAQTEVWSRAMKSEILNLESRLMRGDIELILRLYANYMEFNSSVASSPSDATDGLYVRRKSSCATRDETHSMLEYEESSVGSVSKEAEGGGTRGEVILNRNETYFETTEEMYNLVVKLICTKTRQQVIDMTHVMKNRYNCSLVSVCRLE